MAFPSEVNSVVVKDGLEFDKSGQIMKVRTYTFYVQNHGPFVEKFYAGEQDTAAVTRRITDLVASLREQGVLTTK